MGTISLKKCKVYMKKECLFALYLIILHQLFKLAHGYLRSVMYPSSHLRQRTPTPVISQKLCKVLRIKYGLTVKVNVFVLQNVKQEKKSGKY